MRSEWRLCTSRGAIYRAHRRFIGPIADLSGPTTNSYTRFKEISSMFHLSDLYLLAPELSLSLVALVVLTVDLFTKRRIVTVTVGLVGLIIPAAFAISLALTLDFSVPHRAFFNMLVVDQYAVFFKILFLLIAAVMILASYSYVGKYVRADGEFYTLMLLSVTGMMLLASTGH